MPLQRLFQTALFVLHCVLHDTMIGTQIQSVNMGCEHATFMACAWTQHTSAHLLSSASAPEAQVAGGRVCTPNSGAPAARGRLTPLVRNSLGHADSCQSPGLRADDVAVPPSIGLHLVLQQVLRHLHSMVQVLTPTQLAVKQPH